VIDVNRIADARVAEILDLAQALLADNAEHVAACGRIDAAVTTPGPAPGADGRSTRARRSPPPRRGGRRGDSAPPA
jgi:hypothetical protein